jgi:chloramphenicol O-acetyltransferase type B
MIVSLKLFPREKYQTSEEGKFMMPFSVQIHRAFVDGIHVVKLADKLQRYLDEV